MYNSFYNTHRFGLTFRTIFEQGKQKPIPLKSYYLWSISLEFTTHFLVFLFFFSGYGSKRGDYLRYNNLKSKFCSHWKLFCGVSCEISSVQASMLGRCPVDELGGCISWSWDEWRNLGIRSSIWNPIRSLRVIIPLTLHIQND